MTYRPSAHAARVCLSAALILVVAGCSDPRQPTPAELDSTARPVVYGDDDRLDYYESAVSAAHRALADSTMAMVYDTQLDPNGSDFDITDWMTLQERKNVCVDSSHGTEPFWDQPDPAWCTGFLIAEDLVATAGHCVTSADDCAAVSFVFGFRMDAPGSPRLTVPAEDVRACLEIVDRVDNLDDDWAVIRVAPVTHRTPLAVRTTGSVSLGTPLLLIGHPMGLPVKIAGSNATTVRENGDAYAFQANVDAYGGNSGSPVFNLNTLEVEGILVAGNTDLVQQTGSGPKCYLSHVCPDDTGCSDGFTPWETVTRATNFAHVFGPPPAPCAFEDAHEPNETSSGLPILFDPTEDPFPTSMSVDTLSVCKASVDWYRVWVPADETFSAEIDFAHADGDLSLELYYGSTLLDGSYTDTDGEQVSGSRTSEGSLYILVKGVGNAANTYSLDMWIGDQPAITATGQGCWDSGDTREGGVVAFGCGPVTSQLGALQLQTGELAAADKATLDLRDWPADGSCQVGPIGDDLSQVTSIGYTWLVESDGGFSWAAPAIKLIIDTSDADGTSEARFETIGDKILVYEPYLQTGAMMAENVWLTESITASSGLWWLVDLTPGGSVALGSVSRADLRTLAEWNAAFVAAGLGQGVIASAQIGIGSANAGLDSWVGNLSYEGSKGAYLAQFSDPIEGECGGGGASPSSVLKATAGFLDRGVATTSNDVDIRLAADEVRGDDVDEKNATLAGLSAELKRIAARASTGRSYGVLKKLDDLSALADGGPDDLLSGEAAEAFTTMLDRARP